MKKDNTILIIGAIILLVVLNNLGIIDFLRFMIFPGLNWELESSTCGGMPLNNPGDKCEYILKLEIPNNANDTSFYIEANQKADDVGFFKNEFTTYIFNPTVSSYEEIDKKTIDVSDDDTSGISYLSYAPGTELYGCYDEDKYCPGQRYAYYACEDNIGLPHGLIGPEAIWTNIVGEVYTYYCINAPDCYIHPNPRDGYYTKTMCILDKKSFDKSYFLEENETIIKFKLITKRISGVGQTSPTSYNAANLIYIDFTIAPETPKIYYRFSNNVCNQISILESEKLSNDYDTLNECENHIVSGKQTYYRLENNECSEIELYFEEVTVNDYLTLEECEQGTEQEVICSEGFTYNENTNKCEKYPDTGIICLEGTYNSVTGKCEIRPEIVEIVDWDKLKEFFNKELFPIGEFQVKLWQLIIGLFLILLLIPRKR